MPTSYLGFNNTSTLNDTQIVCIYVSFRCSLEWNSGSLGGFINYKSGDDNLFLSSVPDNDNLFLSSVPDQKCSF